MKKILFPVISIFLIAAPFFTYNCNKLLKYKYYVEKGNLYLSQQNYSSALTSYKSAFAYINNSIVMEKINTASQLNEEMIKYNSAVSLIGNKEYGKALEIFNSISNFKDSDNKIKECKSLICSEKLNQAKNFINQENYNDAEALLKDILAIDSNNTEADNLLKSCKNSLEMKINEKKRLSLLKNMRGVYKLLVDLESQYVYIYKYDKLLKTMLCSSGMDGYDTPEGKFTVTDRGKFFYSNKYEEGAFYWVRFYNAYLFHSVPTDKNRNIIQSEADNLGTKASHGCIRLSMEDAKWIYENISRGISRVLVY